MKNQKLVIVGLGYVGLPLALQFARCGVHVLGLDIDAVKVNALRKGESYIKHIEAATIAEMTAAGRFSASTDFTCIDDVDAVIICVPTPLNRNREPDISYILETCMLSILARLPGQIEWINWDTMPAKTGARVKRHETEWLGLCGLDHFPNIDPHRGIDHLQLVHQRDIHAAEDVLQQLGRFCHTAG